MVAAHVDLGLSRLPIVDADDSGFGMIRSSLRYYGRRIDAMKIPDAIRRCVAFVGFRNANGIMVNAGTCFFLNHDATPDINFMYSITAKHVIDGIRDRGCSEVFVRLNYKGQANARWSSTPIDEWRCHPDDDTTDVAVFNGLLPSGTDQGLWPMDAIADEKTIKAENIGIGDEVFLTGLFRYHHGERRNLPIVRVGNIAAMPEEKVYTPYGYADVYLAETRSLGGLSGSPVFVNLGPIRVVNGQFHYDSTRIGRFYLLGLMQGHFKAGLSTLDEVAQDAAGESINTGIGIVIPISKIVETILQPVFAKHETAFIEEVKKGKVVPVFD
jgi:hypothetical protein